MNRAQGRALRRRFDAGQPIVVTSQRALVELTTEVLRGCAVHVVALHGEGCDAARCSCSPEFRIQPATAANVARGAQAERVWRKDTSS